MIKKTLLMAALLMPLAIQAQENWPTKPITFIVPYPPGGPTDLMARLIAAPLSEKLKVPVVVENKAGASGNIGTGQVVKAKPDGYTILLAASGNLAVNQFLYKNLGFDPLTDLAPVMQISKFPLVLEVAANSDIRDFKDYVSRAKEAGSKVTFGSASNGSPQHLAGEIFKTMVGAPDMMHVPYKGAGPALIDLMGGQITSMFDILGSSMQHIQSGRLRALAVTTNTRASMLPQVPSISEMGYPDFNYYAWHGISTTAGTPRPIIDKLNAELRSVFEDPAFQAKWKDIGSEMVAGTPEAFDSVVRGETEKMGALLKQLNISLD